MSAGGGPRAALVLASASPRRRSLLETIGLAPCRVRPAGIDETPRPGEAPRALAMRLAQAKAAAARAAGEAAENPGAPEWILAADTVVARGRRILGKPQDETAARACLAMLSGRRHRVHTAVAVVAPDGRAAARIASAHVRFKRLTEGEIAAYAASGEWRGKAGGYAIQGRAGAFVIAVNGSCSGVVGLPLYETRALLAGMGFPAGRAP